MAYAQRRGRCSTFLTRHLDEMQAVITRLRPLKLLEKMDRENEPDVSLNSCRFQNLALNYGGYGAAVRLDYAETDFATQIFRVRGDGHKVL